MQPMASTPCPCGLPRAYDACCGRWHAGDAGAHRRGADAVALQRLRAGPAAYLLATWHASTRPSQLPPPEPGLRWLGLDVKRHQVIDADHATVEFVARSKLGGRAQRLHELSRFVREDGRWFYVDGDLR
jgi:SEC-C motif-containing protein